MTGPVQGDALDRFVTRAEMIEAREQFIRDEITFEEYLDYCRLHLKGDRQLYAVYRVFSYVLEPVDDEMTVH